MEQRTPPSNYTSPWLFLLVEAVSLLALVGGIWYWAVK